MSASDETVIDVWGRLPERGSPWQPIETAPKDGSMVLLLEFTNLDDYNTQVSVGLWTDLHAGHVVNDEMVWADWAAGLNEDDEWSALNPTHWMPLPEPPRHSD